ncbi:hypothetical protein BDY21DRAFT_278427 [Lineolata rhizophorae]|uniref:DUF6536 domain-containing protein n=1 Tax=Lineolata rhizophorae TaxID=578093 RepID=A0A6A6PCL0_9PEZI|nr:hypothetical protein BDY21DRAFT_278427 [Lineolata rhizophorae]
MQLAVAPTRHDLDEAHSRKRWLDIGVPSIRNLEWVSIGRRVAWALLFLSAMPLHLFYNASFFFGRTTTEYLVAEMGESFLDTGPSTALTNVSETRPGVLDAFENIVLHAPSWDRFTPEECAAIYSKPLMTGHRTLVLITEEERVQRLPGLWSIVGSGNWMCDDDNDDPDPIDPRGASCHPTKARFGDRDGAELAPGTTLFCLAEPFAEDCKLEVSTSLLVAVAVCNALQVFGTLLLFFVLEGPSPLLVTVGDAAASFLARGDIFTKGLCAYDHWLLRWRWPAIDERLPIPWTTRTLRRHAGVSKRWLVMACAALAAAIILAIISLGLALAADARRGTISAAMSYGAFLAKNRVALISLARRTVPQVALLVNLPQLAFSALYLLYNAVLSGFLQAAEWNRFARARHPLRLSARPGGKQRATRWLSLPPRYGAPLALLGALTHWLISQTIFLADVSSLDFSGRDSVDHNTLAAGYSSLCVLLVLIFVLVAAVALAAVGLRPLTGDMTVAGSCSAAIAAACQNAGETEFGAPVGGGAEDGFWTLPLQWGSLGLEDPDGVGHLAFSSMAVMPPLDGALYR